MTKYSRVTAKVFGETASTTNTPKEIGQFGSAKAGTYNATGDVATIQNLAAWSNGWVDAVTPTQQFPSLPEMTGVHKVLSYQEAYLLQQGIAEWDSSTIYYVNNFCAKNGKIYISQSDENLNNDPESDTVNWQEFTSGGSSRNIGEIIASTIPLTDAGLHLLDGTLIQGSGIYSDFVDYMANLYNDSEITPEWNKNILINLPTFSSNTQDGITISDSRGNTTVLQAIFNGTNNLNQIGYWSTYWININYNQATIIDSYTIQADNSGAPEYPSAWTLQASNDGTNWDILDTQTGVTFSLNQSKTFSVTTHTRYEQYRLVFSNGVESSNNGELKKVTFNVYTPIQTIENTYFTTESQWQQSVTDYGVCGKFVYDSVNNTVRLPKITGFVEGTTDVTTLGDLVEAGLPNITGSFGGNHFGTASGAFSYNNTNKGYSDGNAYEQGPVTFDASGSNSIYGNSDTVQPQSVKVLYYIVIATSTKTAIEVDIDEIATDLNGKADVDLTNVNNSGTSKVASWAMPSNTNEDVTLGANGATYTAPANGWFTLVGYNGSAGSTTLLNETSSVITMTGSPTSAYYAELSVPCAKNDVIQLSWHNGNLYIPAEGWFKFVYAKGSESEA